MAKVAILGFGREGQSLFKFLNNPDVVVLDKKTDRNYLANLSSFDVVYRSPGVPYNLSEIQTAIKNGVKFSSATKLFFERALPVLRRGSGKIIGVTGTKGKGTTSTLIAQILKNSHQKVLLAGNIGISPLEILPKLDKNSLVVLELSSFQLQDLENSPQVAVITEIFPDHLDVHKNIKEYLDAKANICRYQKKSDPVFYFAGNRPAAKIVAQGSGKMIAVSAPDNLTKNHLLAAAVARHLSCSEKIIQSTLKNFNGLKHRLERLGAVKGIEFYNDSASTNPQTTAKAVSSFEKSLVLIAGGKDKNLDYAPLAKAIKASRSVLQVLLFGENKNKIFEAIAGAGVPVRLCRDLEAAVAEAVQKRPEIVLFSPGAASFDMFKDYADRGERFKNIVRSLSI
ncbi:MAG: UDP-N-acetylmuramoylalanine/D-glutamate ligase [Parcubacteria group bacterium GW2011_GWA2_47_8b]|uniref:UDP-N-acetylmuramoylalanine--D-glutamate ligase n=2 Tax=Candidatus Harrisoniibacteriota TaxID=1817905 RepID=A0A1G1ZWD8_9BACT|nr:MAG: UDP-N-acetylmuramoylalanine/D-glutamate ligase [Parcubacteria group bacterium GW2011_GWA2_47_8b]KKU94772.1 MAG: UDP-N-acetylmuramoylalanine/D-glutamate ligase [Parcubacteria group bacterium GW2011_GWA1_48_11b]OGY63283.1 MAG: hypothetical protein A3E64_01395 [Candidatus Harrisonbacteria bacterium RIFCSPHIGHO2_12_FULL_48_16]OGY68795.1 MAG: hypothetical protein A2214_00325 [Candidatus Harrisonbacteria bacterium RIFOXYA1_FULL_48_8]